MPGDRDDKIRLERRDAVAELVLDRPQKLNAIDEDCLRLMRAHLDTVEADASIRVLIVRGNGRVFCGGADLECVGALAGDPVRFGAFLADWHGTYDRFAQCTKPVIASVHGLALAGGFELTQVCDFVVVEEDAKIGDQHANFGLFPGGGSTQRLPRLIGERRAMWLLLSGEWISPAEALQFGLVNAVARPGEAITKAREMAAILATKSPLANRNIKKAVRLGMQMELPAALELEQRIAVEHMQSEDVAIGLAAFRSRGKPRFVGR